MRRREESTEGWQHYSEHGTRKEIPGREREKEKQR